MRILLDANAGVPCDVRAVAAMAPHWSAANPSSPHGEGQRARAVLEAAREEVARLLGATPREIVFVSGGTEANNLAVAGLARATRRARPERSAIVVSAVEHASVAEPARALSADGFELRVAPVGPDGVVDPGALARLVDERCALIAVQAANNEVGTIQPLAEVRDIARRAGALLHVDAVQAVGRIPLDFGSLGADSLSASAHKLHGPRGIGALALRAGAVLDAQMQGGSQERKRRAGTEPVALAVGFAEAARIARESAPADALALAALRDRLEAALLAIPGMVVHCGAAPRLPNTLSVRFEGVSGETLVARLDLEGIAASTGSACSTGVSRPSATLLALGLSREEAAGALRFSLSRTNTAEEIAQVAALVPRLVSEIRTSRFPG